MDSVSRRSNAFVKRLAAGVKSRRTKLGLSQYEVANRAGVSSQYVGYIERGLRVPTVDTLARLAIALECRPSEICSDAEPAS